MGTQQRPATAPAIGATVRHPLYPELGTGTVLTIGARHRGTDGTRNCHVQWSTGQISRHDVTILRTVPPADEHTWHACTVPAPPVTGVHVWHCPTCHQRWTWRRPPQPPPQWTRTREEL